MSVKDLAYVSTTSARLVADQPHCLERPMPS
jgi:hypothetical protein